MKKLLISAMMLLSVSASFAGTMGVIKPLPVLIPFVDAEASYTSPDVEGFSAQVNGVGSFVGQQNRQGWGGRIAGGALHPFTERWAGSAELGFGYYGSVKMDPAITITGTNLSVTPTGDSMNMKFNQYGTDILVGLFYTQPKYDLFFKVGALVQNLRATVTMTPNQMFGDNQSSLSQRLNGTYTTKVTLANALPALRLGGGYHLNEDWMVMVSWFHAFGSTLEMSMPNLTRSNGGTVGSFGSILTQIAVPTIDSVMFGLDYRFN